MKTSVVSQILSVKKLVLLATTLMILTVAHSQTAGNWPLNSNVNGTAGSHLTTSVVSLGPSITSSAFNSGSEWYGEGGWTAASTPDVNGYIQFTFTANSGYYLVLNTVTLVQRRSNTGSPQGAGPNKWSLRSSLDNYTTDITTGSMTYDYATYTVTLPAAYHAIASGVTFRLYGYNTTINSGGINRFVFDNISVQGQSVSGVLAEQSINLTARPDGEKNIFLQWNAAGFEEGTEFAVQRSSNGMDFTPIFQTKSATQYNDATLPSTVFYRVTATLPDGSNYLSPVVSIKQDLSGKTAIKGVIAQGGSVKALLHLEGTGAYQLGIWSQDGKPLARQAVNGQTGDVQSDVAWGNYPHGVYILTLSNEGRLNSRAFVY